MSAPAVECLAICPSSAIDNQHGDHQRADDSESVEEKPVREPHAVLGWPPRSL